jgi:hypothetical protein
MKEGPSGSAIRSLIPSHRERLWSKAMIVIVAETSGDDPGRNSHLLTQGHPLFSGIIMQDAVGVN